VSETADATPYAAPPVPSPQSWSSAPVAGSIASDDHAAASPPPPPPAVSSHAARSVPDGQSDAARGPLPPPTAVAAETAAHARAEPGGGVAGQSVCGSVPKTGWHGSSSRPQSKASARASVRPSA